MRMLALLGPALAVTVVLPGLAGAQAAERPAPERPAAEPEGPVGGILRTETGASEILPEPPPVGRTVNVPEGWYRVESAPRFDRRATGSFSVVRPEVLAPPAPAQPQGPRGAQVQPQAVPGTAAPAPGPELAVTFEPAPGDEPIEACRNEREAYVELLLGYLEIDDVEHPLALLEGLEGIPGDAAFTPYLRLSLFGLPTAGPLPVDPIRPLAWDFDLQLAARDLAACVLENR